MLGFAPLGGSTLGDEGGVFPVAPISTAVVSVSRMSQYAVLGPTAPLFLSRMSQYVVVGPPPAPPKRLGVAVF